MLATNKDRPQIVLVGGGHAHVQVLRRFSMQAPAAHVWLVLDEPVAIYSGMVPGLIAKRYQRHEAEIDLVPLARLAKATVVLSACRGIDSERRQISFEDRAPLRYDVLSLNVGATSRLPTRAAQLTQLPSFVSRPIGKLVQSLELLEKEQALEQLVVVGAGVGGVELTFALATRFANASITLVEGSRELLPGLPASAQAMVERKASERGIRLLLGRRAQGSSDSELVLDDDTRLPCDALVWATDAVGQQFLAESSLPTSQAGFVRVRSTLQVVGLDEVFAVGDCASLETHPTLPKAGVYAVRQGSVLADNLLSSLAGTPLKDFVPQRDALILLNLADDSALGVKWGQTRVGKAAMRLKDTIDRRYMRKFQVLDSEGVVRPDFERAFRMDDAQMQCGGCAAKASADVLSRALSRLNFQSRGLLPFSDDASAHLLGDHTLVSSVDMFRAFSDDGFVVGQVAALNAMSDVFAKGAEPRFSQAIVALPEQLGPREQEELLVSVLAGAQREFQTAGAELAGGHTLMAAELAVGFCVMGTMPLGQPPIPASAVRPGQRLVLSKGLGTGVLLRAHAQGRARGLWYRALLAAMLRSNQPAAAVARGLASAVTDVTGFGLARHLLSMLAETGLGATLELNALPVLSGALQLVELGIESTFHPQNAVGTDTLRVAPALREDPRFQLLFDPQTAGGLLLAVDAARLGELLRALHTAGDHQACAVGSVVEGGGLTVR